MPFLYVKGVEGLIEFSLFAALSMAGIGATMLIQKRRKRKGEKELVQASLTEIDRMGGFQFEKYLEQLYKGEGYKVTRTKERSDFGADLILKKDSTKVVVQCKRYSKGVGIKAVQEISSARSYYKADAAWVVTNSLFTASAIKLAEANNVKLIDRAQLKALIAKYDPHLTQAHGVKAAVQKKEKVEVAKGHFCKKCGAQMVIRHSTYGTFYGCSQFPTCRFTKKIRIRGQPL